MKTLIYPNSYKTWLQNTFPNTVTETLATCQQCIMVKPEGQTRDPGPFLSHLKCCTYFPFLPNFTLGSLSFETIQYISKLGILLPVGLYPSTDYQNRLQQAGRQGFGKKQELLCPFYDQKQNGCSIWEYRPGVCASYFCKSNQGEKGLQLWADVENYLNHFEWKLATETLFRLHYSENELAYCQGATSPDTDESERDYFIQAAWGPEKQNTSIEAKFEFYRKTKATALKLTGDDISRLFDKKYQELELKIRLQLSI